MPFGLRWPFWRKPSAEAPAAGAEGSVLTAARLSSEPHPLEIDPELGAALARRAAGAAGLPRLGPQAGLRQVARALVGAEEFARTLTAPAWSSEVARDLELPAGASAGEFASRLGSLTSLRDPWSTGPLESGSPFAETFAPAESATIFAAPWGPRATAGATRGGTPAAQPPRVAARLASAAPLPAEPGLVVSGGTWSAPVASALVPAARVRLVQPLADPAGSPRTTPPIVQSPALPGAPAPVPPAEALEPFVAPRQASTLDLGPSPSLAAQPVIPGEPSFAPVLPAAFVDLPLATATPPAAAPVPAPEAPPIQREAATGAPEAASAPPPGAAAETSVAGPAPSPTAPPSEPSTPQAPSPGPPARILTPSEMLITPGLLPAAPPGDQAAPARPEAPMTLFARPEDAAAAPVPVQRAPDAPAAPAVPPPARPAEPASAPIAPVSAEPSPARVAEPPIPVQRDAVPPLPPTAEGEATLSEQRPPTQPPGPVPMPLVEPPPEIAQVSRSEESRPAEAPPKEPMRAAAPAPSPARPAEAAELAGAPASAQRSNLELHSPASFAEGIVRRHAESVARGPAAVVASARRLVARYATAGQGASGAPPSTPTTTPLAFPPAPSASPASIETEMGLLSVPAWDETPYSREETTDFVLPAASAPSPWAAAGQTGPAAPPLQRQAIPGPPPIPAAAREERFAPVSDLPLAPVAAAAAGAGPVQLFREAPQGEQASGTVTSAGTQAPAGEQAAPAENIDRLADRVWQIVRRKLQIERERQRGLP